MESLTKKKLLASLSIGVISSCWAYSWIVMKAVNTSVGAWDFSAARCILASLSLFIILFCMKRPLSPPPLKPTIIVGVLQTAGMTGFAQWALEQGGAGSTAIFTYTMPFWLIILSALFLHEKLTKLQLIALVLAGIGLLFVIQPWNNNVSIVSACIAIGSGFFWACGSLYGKNFFAKTKGHDMLNFTAWQILFGSIVLSAVALMIDQRPIVYSPKFFYSLLYSGVISTGICWTLWLFVLSTLSTSVTGVSMLLVPALSVFLAWVLLGEMPNHTKMIGVGLIICALVLITFRAYFSSKAKNF